MFRIVILFIASIAFSTMTFAQSGTTRVVLMMKDVDSGVARSWFNAYAMGQGGGGMGGMGSSLSGAQFEVDLEMVMPDDLGTDVVLVVPSGTKDEDLKKFRTAMRRSAIKYGLNVADDHREMPEIKVPFGVVRTVVSQSNQEQSNFRYWATVARELAGGQLPTIEIGYQEPSSNDDGGDMYGGMEMGMEEMMMGGYGGDMESDMYGGGMAAPAEPQLMNESGFVETNNLMAHWSKPENRLAAVSRVDGEAAWVAIEVDLTNAQPVIVSDGLAAVRVGKQAYAFSASQSRWDEVQVQADDWDIVVSSSGARIEDGSDWHVFTDEAGRWMSLSGARLQSADSTTSTIDPPVDSQTELSTWRDRAKATQEKIDDLVLQFASGDDRTEKEETGMRDRLREFLLERAAATKNARQWRGQEIIRQATELIDEAERAHQTAVEAEKIDEEVERLLRHPK